MSETLPSEEDLVEALRNGDRDPIDDADEIRRPSKYICHYVHWADGCEVGVTFKYSGGFTDHGKALEPYDATILTPRYGDNAATYVH